MADIVMTPAIRPLSRVMGWLATPAIVIFLSSNLVNAGNLAFNLIFSRLMGPELFGALAFLLTVKLALLGVLGAVQTATSRKVAQAGRDPRLLPRLAAANRLVLIGGAGLAVVLAAGYALGAADDETRLPMVLLLAALPFGASMSLLRGLAYGQMRSGRIALSANVEMLVRLLGALLAWVAGLGLPGVAAAIAVSILAGWAVLADMLPRLPARDARRRALPVLRLLTLGAIPFALLQVAQVIAIDGDIFLARAVLSPLEAGHVAALSLFQRIQFFANYALAGVMLPAVISARGVRREMQAAILPIAVLFVSVTALLLTLALVAPKTVLTLLVGPEYHAAAPHLWVAALAAAAFTLSYLLATLLVALKDRTGIFLALGAAVIQMVAMAMLSRPGLAGLVQVEAITQVALCALLSWRAIKALARLGAGSR